MKTHGRAGGGQRASLLALRRSWPQLTPPALDELVGDLAASFLPPLHKVAPAGLGLVGLPRWWGKRFVAAEAPEAGADTLAGVNLVRRPAGERGDGTLVETLPMTARLGASLADGRPAVVVSYAADGPRPWRWVRDEIRCGSDGGLVGMTYVDVPGLRRAGGTPFLLQRPAPRP